MRGLRTLLLVVAALGAITAQAQTGSITMLGSIAVREAGTGMISGRVAERNRGSFSASFTDGEVAAFRLTKVTGVQIPGSTAFFTGEGIALVRRNGGLVERRASLLVMVDDLDHDRLPFPDQILMDFTFDDGHRVIRHGQIIRGDIAIRLR